ncbi:MAG: LysR substrate-binding domain-containing protein [Gordonibacter sp.]|uniref:LysR family transcriptional regulator n=1 Tax=Gordonibacter sp. TaxID=1968902 RepID=UPI002FC8B90C
MRVDTLYEFLLLTTNLSFTETAKSFFVSQSVLSDHISRLEKELDTCLFVRDRHSVRLTEAGRLFQEDAQRIVEDYEHALDRLSQYRDGVSTVIRIGFLMGSFGAFLPLVCRRYRTLHPEVDFRFRMLEIGEIQPSLNRNDIDMGLTLFSKEAKGAQYGGCRLYDDSYQLAVPATHHLAHRESVRMADLVGERVIAARFNRAKNTIGQMNIKLNNAGVSVRIIEDMKDVGSLMATLVAEGAVALALDHLDVFGGGNIVFVPMEDLDMTLHAGALWKKSKETEALLSFAEFLKRDTSSFKKADFLSRKGAEALPLRDLEA